MSDEEPPKPPEPTPASVEDYYHPDHLARLTRDRQRALRFIQKKTGAGEHVPDSEAENQISAIVPEGDQSPALAPKEKKNYKRRVRRLLEDPLYMRSLQARLILGTAPHMETLLHQYAYGKPATTIKKAAEPKSGTPTPQVMDLTALTPDELKKLQQVLEAYRDKIKKRTAVLPFKPA